MTIPHRTRDALVRAYPYPYNAWLTVSNDPDNTLIKDWRELDRVIWKEMELPFSDSLFFRSFNKNLREQVDLHGHPEIYGSHPHDTIHTWGDYLFGGARGFEREDAQYYAGIAAGIGFRPRVWVDHSTFTGNLLHNHRYGAIPEVRDASGHVYPSPLYSLDIIQQVGVRFAWDGTITHVLGQDRPKPWMSYHLERTATKGRGLLDFAKHRIGHALGIGNGFRAQFQDNSAYRPHRFPDGTVLYTFQRHGRWEKADIHGLGDILAPDRIDQLTREGGVCIAYTHLGKRPADSMKDEMHIPEKTLAALRHLKMRHQQGELMLSGLGRLLDHLVIRDHIHVNKDTDRIEFQADGIAFDRIDAEALQGHSFSILDGSMDLTRVQVAGSEGLLTPRIERNTSDCFTLHFDRP